MSYVVLVLLAILAVGVLTPGFAQQPATEQPVTTPYTIESDPAPVPTGNTTAPDPAPVPTGNTTAPDPAPVPTGNTTAPDPAPVPTGNTTAPDPITEQPATTPPTVESDPAPVQTATEQISPSKQMREGIPLNQIQCNDQRILIESPVGKPVCVFDGTVEKLSQRGWNVVGSLESTTDTVEVPATDTIENPATDTPTEPISEEPADQPSESIIDTIAEPTTNTVENSTTNIPVEESTTNTVENSTTNTVENSTTNTVENSTTNTVENSTTNIPVEEPTTNTVENSTTNTVENSTTNTVENSTTNIPVEESTTNTVENSTTNIPVEEPVTDPPVEEPVTDPPVEEPVTDPPVEEPVTDTVEEPTTNIPTESTSEETADELTTDPQTGDGQIIYFSTSSPVEFVHDGREIELPGPFGSSPPVYDTIMSATWSPTDIDQQGIISIISPPHEKYSVNQGVGFYLEDWMPTSLPDGQKLLYANTGFHKYKDKGTRPHEAHSFKFQFVPTSFVVTEDINAIDLARSKGFSFNAEHSTIPFPDLDIILSSIHNTGSVPMTRDGKNVIVFEGILSGYYHAAITFRFDENTIMHVNSRYHTLEELLPVFDSIMQ